MTTKVPLDVAYRDAIKRQHPIVPTELVDSLPIDFDAVKGQPYIHQSGGWVMVFACDDRLLSTEDATFYVAEYPDEDSEGDELYEGDDFA